MLVGGIVALLLHGTGGLAHAGLGDCGQPASTGDTPVATDALFTLGAAVGSRVCELCVCDLNNDGSIAATDALIDLSAAVGQSVSLDCPACAGTFCFESEAPSCGGGCEEGLSCLPDPEEPEECTCLNACEASPAPTCGGSCEGDEPGSLCTSVQISPTGLDPIELCECLPPDIAFCADAASPDCEGVCGAGAECVSDGGSGCMCSSLPAQPDCEQAQAPSCLGSCADTQQGSTICESDGGGSCVCVPFTMDDFETCYDAQGPTCGGVCAFGDVCAVEDGDCECVAPCELDQAPACGGDCTDEGESCIVTTFTVGGRTGDFCECWVVE